MAHRTARAAYLELTDRLNRFPQGAPASDLLAAARDSGLVQFGEKVQQRVNFICNCCGCCCGVCVPACPEHGLQTVDCGDRVTTPVDSTHPGVAMAVERGTLQYLLIDAQELSSHRMMAALLGAILRLPPVRRFLATSQVGSRYLDALIEGAESGSPKTGREAS